jgi:hypothetical protein
MSLLDDSHRLPGQALVKRSEAMRSNTAGAGSGRHRARRDHQGAARWTEGECGHDAIT